MKHHYSPPRAEITGKPPARDGNITCFLVTFLMAAPVFLALDYLVIGSEAWALYGTEPALAKAFVTALFSGFLAVIFPKRDRWSYLMAGLGGVLLFKALYYLMDLL